MKRNIFTYSNPPRIVKKFKGEIPKQNTDEKNCDNNEASTYYLIINPDQESVKNENNIFPAMKSKKIFKQCQEKYLDDAMEKWFEQLRDRNESISGRGIQDKALFFHKKINGTSEFKASSAWLYRFKKRCGIQYIVKKEGNNSEGIEHFSEMLKEKIRSENLSLENIYNADETGIHWKVPDFCTSSIETSEMKLSGNDEDICNRVTALFASNSTGNHKIPLLIIGADVLPNCITDLITKSTRNNRLNFLTSINATYAGQSNARMNKEIFKLWYKNVFIPSALNHQTVTGTTGKILLILDNAPCHPDANELNAIHKQFEVVNLAHNLASVVQPMEQGLMSTIIKIYKRNLLHLMFKAKLRNVDDFWINFTLRDCLTFLSSSWETLNSSILRKAWSLVLGDYCDTSDLITVKPNQNTTVFVNSVIDELSSFPDEICDKLIARHSPDAEHSIRKLQKDKVIIVKWFKIRDDVGWDPMTDSEIIKLILANRRKDELLNDPLKIEGDFKPLPSLNHDSSVTFDDCVEDKLVDVKTKVDDDDKVTSSEALDALKRVKKWILNCENSSQNHHHYVTELENLISRYC